jgi:uncharacterized protein
MAFLTWLIRVIIAAIVLRLVMRMFTGAGRPQAGSRAERKRVERAGGALVQDPHCGTYIPQAKAVALGRGADAKYFCSTSCRDQFLSAHGQRHAS